ncbi:hypothetical protein [Pseudonocardia nigra]|uniref:hypothetical protein n=1 Tax=Pseudonocardia nigra TaxID=1921578 RepID=UPI001C5DEE77|nr:hypothetical protein [Pseudonocardia nigra]
MEDPTTMRCRHCGWPEQEPYEVVSRHVTSQGVIVYSRCACGRLQVRRHDRVVLQARTPTPGVAGPAAGCAAR